jgi:cell division protein FtsL
MGNRRSTEKVIYLALIVVSILLISDIISLLLASNLHVGYKISATVIFALYALICGGTISKILTLRK